MCHTLLIFKICITFKDVQKLLMVFFDISNTFRVRNFSDHLAVHSLLVVHVQTHTHGVVRPALCHWAMGELYCRRQMIFSINVHIVLYLVSMQTNWPNPNSIKIDTFWMSRFEFQNIFCNLSLVLGDKLNLALFKKIWWQNFGHDK